MESAALFGGMVYQRDYEGWQIAWESIGRHRLWCSQSRPETTHTACVVMFNPGSLSGTGDGLAKDDTLRILRSAIPPNTSTLILNLFTLATPDPSILFEQWDQRDCANFSIDRLRANVIDSVVWAYGDGGQDPKRNRIFGESVRARIASIRSALAGYPAVTLPEPLISKRGNPKHPKHWRLLRQIDNVKQAISRTQQQK